MVKIIQKNMLILEVSNEELLAEQKARHRKDLKSYYMVTPLTISLCL
jgi:hypothetical protein